jgi:NAD(P)H-hydrate epimerase
VVQHGEALARESADASLAEAVASGAFDGLGERLRALCEYAVKLTREPADVTVDDVEALRAAGLDDRAIVDANQVVAYFNYVNRVADGLGVELEESWPEAVRRARSYPLAARGDDLPVVRASQLPWLSLEQVRELDRIATDELGISLERLMENAGRALAELARRALGGSVAGRKIAVLAGPGGNGGGGLVAARHLAVAGADVEVALAEPPGAMAPVPAAQRAILERIGVPARVSARVPADAELVLDAVFGYSVRDDPRGGAADLIRATAGRRVLALDVPSGFELATGVLREPHVRAEATLALAAPKAGLDSGTAGRLYVADISVPPLVFARLGLATTPPFARGPLVRIR